MRKLWSNIRLLLVIPVLITLLVVFMRPTNAEGEDYWLRSTEPHIQATWTRNVSALHYIKLGWQQTCSTKTYLTRSFLESIRLLNQTQSYCAYDSAIGELADALSNPSLSVDGKYAGKIFGFNNGLPTLTPTPLQTLRETRNNSNYVAFHYNANVITTHNAIGTPTHYLAPERTFELKVKKNGSITNLHALDISEMTYSRNGEWAVISIDNVAHARMNMRTNEILTFAPVINKAYGYNPMNKATISNSGRYAVTTINATTGNYHIRVYDLETCSDQPAYAYVNDVPTNCTYRDYAHFIKQSIPGIQSFGAAEFIDEYTIVFYANTTTHPNIFTRYTLRAPNAPEKPKTYIALGDSYASGEGLFHYFSGTDLGPKVNNCHLARDSYPYLIGFKLNMGNGNYHSVACSGAEMRNIIGSERAINDALTKDSEDSRTNQALFPELIAGDTLGKWHPGYYPQQKFLKENTPDFATISIGGNDIDFAEIVKSCVLSVSTCHESYEDRLEILNKTKDQYSKLVDLYTQLLTASPDTALYVIGYPKIAKEGGDCYVNVRLNESEIAFGSRLVEVINDTIESAAKKAGAVYIDIKNIFGEAMLCGSNSISAVNGLTKGDDMALIIGNESYHPTTYGHELISGAVLAQSQDFYHKASPDNSITGPTGEHDSAFLNAPKTFRETRQIYFDSSLSNDIYYLGQDTLVLDNYSNSDPDVLKSIKPHSSVQLEIHSSPTLLAATQADVEGTVSLNAIIPSDIPFGPHTLHLYVTTIDGSKIDIIKRIYVAHTPTDKNGDGTPDSEQDCGPIAAADVDYDQDGIDDGCDPVISEPAPTTDPAEAEDSDPAGALDDDTLMVISTPSTPLTSPTFQLAAILLTNKHGMNTSSGMQADTTETLGAVENKESQIVEQNAPADTDPPCTPEGSNGRLTLFIALLIALTLIASMLYAKRNGKGKKI